MTTVDATHDPPQETAPAIESKIREFVVTSESRSLELLLESLERGGGGDGQ